MTDREAPRPETAEALSALTDGEADAATTAELCRHWRGNERLRADWHAYHLIGDALRAEDLAQPAERDERFLQALRVRLAQEPVVLAPPVADSAAPLRAEPAQVIALPSGRASGRLSGARRLRRWAAPVGIAAGVMVVSSAVLVLRTVEPSGMGGVTLAGSTLTGAPRLTSFEALPDRTASAVALAASADGGVVRVQDGQIDPYLQAHRQYQSVGVYGAGSYLRSASYESSGQ